MAGPEPGRRFPWRPRVGDLAGIAGLYLATRLLLVGVGMLAWSHQLPNSNWRGVARGGIHYALAIDQPFLDMWTRWDSWEYEEIAREGYWYDPDAKPRPYGTVACFPLYPLAVRGVGTILGGRYILGGLVVSNLSALVGLVLLFQWAIWRCDRPGAWLAVWSAIAFPAGLFWSAMYPQSLFFALSIGSLSAMFDRRTALACLLAMFATATRLEAVALLPALLAIYYRENRGRVRVADAAWFLVTPLGLVAYMAYLASRWGDPLLFLRVHENFGRGIGNPLWTLVKPLWTAGGLADQATLGTYAVVGFLMLGHRARLDRLALLYAWLLLSIPLCTGTYLSIYRVHLVNAPLYLAIGFGFRGRWRPAGWVLSAVFLWMQVIMMSNWVSGYFLP